MTLPLARRSGRRFPAGGLADPQCGPSTSCWTSSRHTRSLVCRWSTVAACRSESSRGPRWPTPRSSAQRRRAWSSSVRAASTLLAVSIGGCVPLALKRFGVDPAVASGPLLTTVTDMAGFFLVLSLATLFLPNVTG